MAQPSIIKKSGATGYTSWHPVPRPGDRAPGTEITLGVIIDGTCTYKGQYCVDDLQPTIPLLITRSGTTATATHDGSRLVTAGDTVVVRDSLAPFLGTYEVATVPSTTTFTFTVANSGPTAGTPAKCALLHPFDHPTLTGKTTSDVGTIAFPVTAVRLNITSWTSGSAQMTILQT
jgi:hypothetical protein